MKSLAAIVVVTTLIVVAAGLAPPRTAEASHVTATITVADNVEVGQPTQLQVELLSENQPVANTEVTVTTDASFAGVTGRVEVGKATSDERGIAVLEYAPRQASIQELRVEYLPAGETEPTVATTTVSVNGATQLHQSAAGIQVPGLNVWLIIAILTGVWSLLLSVGWRVFAIAQAANGTRTLAGSEGTLEG